MFSLRWDSHRSAVPSVILTRLARIPVPAVVPVVPVVLAVLAALWSFPRRVARLQVPASEPDRATRGAFRRPAGPAWPVSDP